MSDKRIIELDVTDVVEADDFLAIDSVSGTTRRIKPIKIGATYEIEDGDHSFTLVGSNGYSHTVNIPYDSVSMTQAEYNALTPAQKADGTARFITDAESDVESELWSKVGRQTLDTEAQVLSNAVNELKGDIDTNTDDISTNTDAISELNSSLPKRLSGTLPSTDNTFTIAYPSGLDKSNMAMIGFGFYRNASWFFNTNAVSVAFTNANISVTIPADFSYIKGLPYTIIYVKID